MFSQYIKGVVLLFLFFSLSVMAVNGKNAPTSIIPNVFNEISIEVIKQGKELSCHQMTTQDDHWKKITFNEIPQYKYFCIRAWIHIDKSLMKNNPSLLVGMLGASSFYWDEKLISKNGKVGTSIESEVPGVIKILASIPEHLLTDGKHLLSGEISTFHLTKALNSIGYILALVDERKLHSQILTLSILSAIFIGTLLVLAFIFQLIFWLYQKEISYQVFSVFCLSSLLILAVEQAKFWLEYTYDWHFFRISIIYSLTFLASSLLPLFYLFNYRLPYKRLCTILIIISLIALSFIAMSFDQASTFLFSGSLIFALVINVYSAYKIKKGHVNLIIIILSLSFLYLIPDYFNEFGFSLVFILIVMTMLVSLIKEMHNNKVEALKAERINTELLRRNMQPHFLMNCLTQLMELIEVKPKEAVEFISVLSDEFRQLTMQSAQDNIALSEEVALCKKHLAIMSVRYQQSYQLIINGELDGVFIPPTILHSQIENCFTHNEISSTRAFELTVKNVNGQLNLVLKTPIDKKIDHQGTGLGEKYIKARLAEFEQITTHKKKENTCSFESYEESQYWVSKFSFSS
jgi:sensor histidine kinase YesM